MVLTNTSVPRLLAHMWKATKQASKAPAAWEQWKAACATLSAPSPVAWETVKMLPVTCELIKHVMLHKNSQDCDELLHCITNAQVTGLLDVSFGTTMFVLIDPFAVVRKRMNLASTFITHGNYDIITNWR